MANDKDRLNELEYLMNIISAGPNSEKLKNKIKRTIIPLYRREYFTDICGVRSKDQQRLKEEFDALYPIPAAND